MRQSHLIAMNAFIMWASKLSQLLPQLILIPYLISNLGESIYGVYALTWSLLMSLEQLQLSFQSGVVKHNAAFLGKGEINKTNALISSSFVMSIILAVVACLAILMIAQVMSDPTGKLRTALKVVALLVLTMYPITPIVAVIQSKQRYFIGAIAESGARFLSLIAILLWFEMVGPSLYALLVITVVALLLSRLVQIPIAYRLIPGLRISFTLFEKESFRLILVFGATIVWASLCLAINSTGIRWLMGEIVSAVFVTHLVIILMPAVLLGQIVDAATITVMPATSAYEASGSWQKLRSLMIRGMRYTAILTLSAIIAATLMLDVFIKIWVGTEYVFLAPYAQFLFATTAFLASTSMAHHMLKGMGKLKTIISIYFFSLVLVTFAILLFILKVSNDPYLAVTAGLASGHIVCGGLQIWFITKALKAAPLEILKRVYLQPMMVFTVIFGTYFLLGIDELFSGFVVRTVLSSLVILLFLLGCYVFILTVSERKQFIDMFIEIKKKMTHN